MVGAKQLGAGRVDNFTGGGGSKAELGEKGRMPRRTTVAHMSYIRLEMSLNPCPGCDKRDKLCWRWNCAIWRRMQPDGTAFAADQACCQSQGPLRRSSPSPFPQPPRLTVFCKAAAKIRGAACQAPTPAEEPAINAPTKAV